MNDFDREIKKSKECIEKSMMNNPQDIYMSSNKTEKRKFSAFKTKMAFKYAVCLLIIAMVSVLCIVLLNDDNHEKEDEFIVPPISENDNEIIKISSKKQIQELLENSSSETNKNDAPEEDSSDDENIGESGGDGYQTNNQIANVDEPDIVKVNGDYIYYITSGYRTYSGGIKKFGKNCLYILKANGNSVDIIKEIILEPEEKILTENYEAKVYDVYSYKPIDILYTDKYLILKYSTSIYSEVRYHKNGVNHYNRSNYRNYIDFVVYDLNNYEEVTKLSVPGYNIATRVIGNEMYIMNEYYDYKNNFNYDLPCYYINDRWYEASCERIYYTRAFGTNINSYLVIFRVQLDETIAYEDFYLLCPSISFVSVNEKYIFIARYYSNVETVLTKDVYTEYRKSKVAIINIEDGIQYDGVVTVEGNVGSRYQIDEYNGKLRIVSSGYRNSYKLVDGKYKYDCTYQDLIHINIFEKKDNKWGVINVIKDDFGSYPRDVRFNGNILTMSTSNKLFYIDLSDSLNPLITSKELVSDNISYQYPYKDNYMINFGTYYNIGSYYDNKTSQGYKISLVDISDPNNIKEVGKPILFDRDEYTRLLVLNNPKELFLDLNRGIFGFRIMKYRDYDNSGGYKYPDGVIKRYYYASDYLLFKIDLDSENPLSLMEEIVRVNNSDFYSYQVYNRMVFIKDKYYLLANDEITVYSLTSNGLTELTKVKLA